MQSTVRNNQTLLDVAVQECGNVESAFEIAERNDLALTDELQTGQTLDIPVTTPSSETVAQDLAAEGVKPATAPSPEDIEMAPYGGIGYMGIEVDFVVS